MFINEVEAVDDFLQRLCGNLGTDDSCPLCRCYRYNSSEKNSKEIIVYQQGARESKFQKRKKGTSVSCFSILEQELFLDPSLYHLNESDVNTYIGLSEERKKEICYAAQKVHKSELFLPKYKLNNFESLENKSIYSCFVDKKSISALKKQKNKKYSTTNLILKQEAVMFQDAKKTPSRYCAEFSLENIRDLRHLILFSNYAIIAFDEMGSQKSKFDKKLRIDKIFQLSSILGVIDLELSSSFKYLKNVKKSSKIFKRKRISMMKIVTDDDTDLSVDGDDSTNGDETRYFETSFLLILDTDDYFTISCATPLHKVLWLDAFNSVITNKRTKKDENTPGWRHDIIRSNIFSAAYIGDAKMLERILDISSKVRRNINAVDSNGYTALHYAVMKKNESCVRVLLDNEANPNVKDKDSSLTPVDYANRGKSRRCAQMLIVNGGVATNSIAFDVEKSRKVKLEQKELLETKSDKLGGLGKATSKCENNAVEYKRLAHRLKVKARK